jgi:hypothetical protein
MGSKWTIFKRLSLQGRKKRQTDREKPKGERWPEQEQERAGGVWCIANNSDQAKTKRAEQIRNQGGGGGYEL